MRRVAQLLGLMKAPARAGHGPNQLAKERLYRLRGIERGLTCVVCALECSLAGTATLAASCPGQLIMHIVPDVSPLAPTPRLAVNKRPAPLEECFGGGAPNPPDGSGSVPGNSLATSHLP